MDALGELAAVLRGVGGGVVGSQSRGDDPGRLATAHGGQQGPLQIPFARPLPALDRRGVPDPLNPILDGLLGGNAGLAGWKGGTVPLGGLRGVGSEVGGVGEGGVS